MCQKLVMDLNNGIAFFACVFSFIIKDFFTVFIALFARVLFSPKIRQF